jgi:hypothetical protein
MSKFRGTRNAPNDSNSYYADLPPPYGEGETGFFKKEWNDLMHGLRGKTRNNVVDLGSGKKATVHKTSDLRFDRECTSHSGRVPGNRHPNDEFNKYSVQANRESRNDYLRNLASGGNGQHRAQATEYTYGGSTLANVHYQSSRQSKLADRDLAAIGRAARTGEGVFVTSPKTNLATVPQERRQRDGQYQGHGPYAGYEGRANPGNPFHNALADGRVPTRCTDRNGTYREAYPPEDWKKKNPDHWFRRSRG